MNRRLCAQVGDLLTSLVTDLDISIEVASFAAVALGLVFVATCHASSVEAILQVGTSSPHSAQAFLWNHSKRNSSCSLHELCS